MFYLVALMLFLPFHLCVLFLFQTGGHLKAGGEIHSGFMYSLLLGPRHLQCGLGSSGVSLTQELVRNAELQTPSQTY